MKEVKNLVKILKALANRRRLRILHYLKISKEATVSQIAAHIGLSFKATSRHLINLYNLDLLGKKQRSTNIFYHLSENLPAIVKQILSLL